MAVDRPSTKGTGIVLGSNVNTDVLHPSKFYSLKDETVRSGFLGAIKGGVAEASTQLPKIVVAGSNFGCGSSRETGARVFQLAGVRAVVAGSFARIFHRNLINLGIPALRCPTFDNQGTPPIEQGEALGIDLAKGLLLSPVCEWVLEPLDPHLKQILEAGGLTSLLEQT